VLVVAVNRNQRLICFYHVIFSVRFDSLFGIAFVFIQWIHLTLWTIFISLVPLQVLQNQDALLCI